VVDCDVSLGIQTVDEIFKELIVALDRRSRKRYSNETVVEWLPSLRKQVHPRIRHLVPTTWHQVLLFIDEHSPIPLCQYDVWDVCPNDCMLFRNDAADALACRHCGAIRHLPDGKPARKYHYFPVLERIKRWYASRAWSAKLEYASKHTPHTDPRFSDVYAGSNWKRIFGDRKVGKYDVAWSLGADGIQLNEKTKYSVVPIFLVCHLFDPYTRHSWDYVFLVGIIPGPGHRNIEVFIKPFLEEIAFSRTNQFRVYDVLTQLWQPVRMYLLFTLADLRGLAGFTDGNQAPAKSPCHECDVVGIHSKALKTTIYPTIGRQLEVGHPLRARLALHPPPISDRSKSEDPRFSTAVDAPRFQPRSHQDLMQAGRRADQSTLSVKNARHPSKCHFAKKTCWMCLLPEYDGVQTNRADSCHCQSNFGKCFAKTAIGYGAGELSQKILLMEFARGRWSFEDLCSKPWVMPEAEAFNNIIRSLKIPSQCGGKLKPPLVLLNTSRYKMSNWSRLVGPLGLYALLKAEAWKGRPEYSKLWVRAFEWWSNVNRRNLVEADLIALEQEGYELYCEMEAILPTKALRWFLHAFTHIVNNIRCCGCLGGCNMFRDERAGATVTKSSLATHDFEAGIANCYRIRDLCSFLRIHKPSLFEFAKPLRTGPIVGSHEFKTGRRSILLAEDLASIVLLCDQMQSAQLMADSLLEVGSSLTVAQLTTPTDCLSFQFFRSAWRKFKTYSKDADVSRGFSTIKWKRSELEYSCGVLVRIVKHRRYNHPQSPINVFLQVSEWDVRDGESSLKLIERKLEPFQNLKWIPLRAVSEEVFLYVDPITADKSKGPNFLQLLPVSRDREVYPES
jgi:hypothetical protein